MDLHRILPLIVVRPTVAAVVLVRHWGLCSLKMALIAAMVDKNPALRSESALRVYAYIQCMCVWRRGVIHVDPVCTKYKC